MKMKRNFLILMGTSSIIAMKPPYPPITKYQKEMSVEQLRTILGQARQAWASGNFDSYLGQLPKELREDLLIYFAHWKALQQDEKNFFNSFYTTPTIKVTKQKAQELLQTVLKGVPLVDATNEQKIAFLKNLFSKGLPQMDVAGANMAERILEDSVRWFSQKLEFRNFQDIANDPVLMGKLIEFIKKEIDLPYPKIVALLNTSGAWQWYGQEKYKLPEIETE